MPVDRLEFYETWTFGGELLRVLLIRSKDNWWTAVAEPAGYTITGSGSTKSECLEDLRGGILDVRSSEQGSNNERSD